MWTNISANIKCPRGDCAYAKTDEKEEPCSSCTCNQLSGAIARTFRYTPNDLMKIRKEEKSDGRTD